MNSISTKRYNNFGTHLRNKFKKRIFKLSINANFTCPNKDGKISKGGCIFCDNSSFATDTFKSDESITKQLEINAAAMKKRYKADEFIAYFQHHSNTYAPDKVLVKKYSEAMKFPGVMGLAIGTRPDCVSSYILDFLNEAGKDFYVWIEYGLQSIHNQTLKAINRGHDYECFLETFKRTRQRNNVNICVHVIHGLPGENKQMMMQTIKEMSRINIHGIKMHQLHVVKNTQLESMYKKGALCLPTLEKYLDIMASSLEYLNRDILIHRLFGVSDQDILVAPKWNIKKNKLKNLIDEYLEKHDIYQGSKLEK